MQSTVKKLPRSTVELKIEASAEELASARKQALARLAKEVKLKGFRPGHAPEDKLIEHVGAETLQRETLSIAVPLLYADAVKKESLPVIGQPRVDIDSPDPLKFTAVVPVRPEVKLGDYSKIKLKKEIGKVEPTEIEKIIADIRKNNAAAKTITDRPAQLRDRVEIDFAGHTPDGVPLDNTSSKNHPIVLGDQSFIPGFEEGVVGMQIGEEKEHTVKFPADYHAKHLADKDVKFKLKLQKIEELTAPELDDEFAQKVSGGQKQKWSEIESDIAEHLQSKKEADAKQKLENDLVLELLKIGETEVPDQLIDEEVEFRLRELQRQLASGGMEWKNYLEQAKKTEDDLKKELRDEAEKRVKVRLILNELVTQEKPEVSDTEVAAEIERLKSRSPENEKPRFDTEFAVDSPNRQRLQHQLRIVKLLQNSS